MRSWLLGLLGLFASALIVFGVIYSQKPAVAPPDHSAQAAPTEVIATPSPQPTPSISTAQPTDQPVTTQTPDLTTDANGLSKAKVIITTTEGVIQFKFYSADAPKTVHRIVELINKGFYNGLSFHRVVPGFVVQGGDPVGNGTGGSGQKIDAEFNNHRHVEGAVAMARASDPNSADSQFYITLGNAPHLDHNYTVFGQVVEGMDVAKKLKIGDKMTTLVITN